MQEILLARNARKEKKFKLHQYRFFKLLEVEPDTDLSFASGKNLQHLAKSRGARAGICSRRKPIDRRGIIAIEQIEELQVGEEPSVFSEIEPFGDAQIHVNEERSRKAIATFRKIQAIEIVVAIHVRRICREGSTVVESALYAENVADVDLPRKLYEPVDR